MRLLSRRRNTANTSVLPLLPGLTETEGNSMCLSTHLWRHLLLINTTNHLQLISRTTNKSFFQQHRENRSEYREYWTLPSPMSWSLSPRVQCCLKQLLHPPAFLSQCWWEEQTTHRREHFLFCTVILFCSKIHVVYKI